MCILYIICGICAVVDRRALRIQHHDLLELLR
jgi:hypothetical protein